MHCPRLHESKTLFSEMIIDLTHNYRTYATQRICLSNLRGRSRGDSLY